MFVGARSPHAGALEAVAVDEQLSEAGSEGGAVGVVPVEEGTDRVFGGAPGARAGLGDAVMCDHWVLRRVSRCSRTTRRTVPISSAGAVADAGDRRRCCRTRSSCTAA